MAKRKDKRVVGNRKRRFQIRSHQVPGVVHVLNEFIYDMCLELGVCPNCHLRLLHVDKNGNTLSKCKTCTDWFRDYNRRRMEGK